MLSFTNVYFLHSVIFFAHSLMSRLYNHSLFILEERISFKPYEHVQALGNKAKIYTI